MAAPSPRTVVLERTRAPYLLLLAALLGLVRGPAAGLGPGDCLPRGAASSGPAILGSYAGASEATCPSGTCCCDSEDLEHPAASPLTCACSSPSTPPSEPPPSRLGEFEPSRPAVLVARFEPVAELHTQALTRIERGHRSTEPPVRVRLGVRLL